jgi:hypothetical protein
MKKLLLTAAAILAALNMYGQGQGSVTFTSAGATGNKLIRDENNAPAGSAYSTALYWGPVNSDPNGTVLTDDRNLIQIGASTPFLASAPGTYFGGGRTITTPGSTANGPVLTFQVRAWKTSTGSSYETAGLTGKGQMFTLKTKDPTDPLTTAPNIWNAAPDVNRNSPGYLGFQIVPEPSVIALGLLGAGALLMLRRRK